MPTYFFDYLEGPKHQIDTEGSILENLTSARQQALLTLRDAVADATSRQGLGDLAITVRDHNNHTVIRAAINWSVLAVS